jgi:hypothetical protein
MSRQSQFRIPGVYKSAFQSLLSLTAIAGSASSSTYKWHTPSACPRTGTDLDLAWMLCTSSLDPRGMIRSMQLASSLSSSSMSSREFSRLIVSRGTSAASRASWASLCSIWLELRASEPPFRSRPLPELMHRAAI